MTNIEAVDNTQDKWRHAAQTMSDAEATQNSKAASESSTIPEPKPKSDKNQWIRDNWTQIPNDVTNNNWGPALSSRASIFCNYAHELATSSARETFSCHTSAAEAVYIFAKYQAYHVPTTIPIPPNDPSEIKKWIKDNQPELTTAFETNWPDEKTALTKDIFYSGFIPTQSNNLTALAGGLYALATHTENRPLTKNRTEYFIKSWNIAKNTFGGTKQTAQQVLENLKQTLIDGNVGRVYLFFGSLASSAENNYALGDNGQQKSDQKSIFEGPNGTKYLQDFTHWCKTQPNPINVSLTLQGDPETWNTFFDSGHKSEQDALAKFCADNGINGLDFDDENNDWAATIAKNIAAFEQNEKNYNLYYSADFASENAGGSGSMQYCLEHATGGQGARRRRLKSRKLHVLWQSSI